MKKADEISDDKKGGFARDMTLRDHYAGLAMQGSVFTSPFDRPLNLKEYAEWSYKMADAMLKARNK